MLQSEPHGPQMGSETGNALTEDAVIILLIMIDPVTRQASNEMQM